MNRGVEIAAEVADLPASVIIDQVRNGVAVRMAVLFLLLGSGATRTRRSRCAEPSCSRAAGSSTRPASARADVVVGDDGRIAAVGADLDGADRRSTPAAASSRPGSSTSTPTCASPAGRRPRRSRPGSRAAALGGYTAVVAMPNTEPAIDYAAVVREVLDLGAQARCATCASPGAITVGRAGEQLAPMAEMAALGVRLFTDDGSGVQDDRLMRRALEYAGGLGVTLAQHCEDESLAAGGHMHEGEWSSRLGIPGQPGRGRGADGACATSRWPGSPARRVHFQHLSTAGSVEHGARGQGRRAAGHGRGDAAPLHAHRRRVRVASTRCSR